MGRNRGRKRLSRMDAAVDAMAQFGFTEAQVKKRVKLLLRVYGGDDAWPFIEDCSYKELIEALLRDDAEEDQGNAIEDGQNVEDRCIEDETDVGTSNAVSYIEEGEIFEDTAPGDPGESTLSMVLASHPDQVSPPSVHEGGGGGVWKDILLTHPSGDTEATATVTGKEIIISPRKNSAPPASPQVRKITSPPANSAPMRRQSRSQPCYGWIDSDDEDSPESIYFEPAPDAFSAKPPKRVSFDITPEREGRRRRRPSRWDEKPE